MRGAVKRETLLMYMEDSVPDCQTKAGCKDVRLFVY